MNTPLKINGHQPELPGRRSLSNRVSRAVLVGLPITALALSLGVAAYAKPIIQRSADSSTIAAVALDGSALDECQGNSGGGNGGGVARLRRADAIGGGNEHRLQIQHEGEGLPVSSRLGGA